MTSTVTVPSHVEIDVRRPNGQVETVNLPDTIRVISPRDFAGIVKQTARSEEHTSELQSH